MKTNLFFLLFSLLILGLASAQRFVEKSVIRYLGNNFILHDGCPEPDCDRSNAECARTISMVRFK